MSYSAKVKMSYGRQCYTAFFIKGEWDEVMKLVKECHMTIMHTEERVVTSVTIDDRPGKPNRIDEKVYSIERRLGKSLKK